MKKINYVFTFLTLGLLVSCVSKQESQPLIQGKVKQETIAVAPKLAGRILHIYVAEGQLVHSGDTLALLDVPELSAKLQQATGAEEAARGQWQLAVNGASAEQLLQVQGQLDAASAQADFARQSYQRMQNMFADSLISGQQFDEVKSKYLAAGAQVNALKAKQKELERGTRTETILSARGQLERAEGARNEVLQAVKETVLLAPEDMMIESITLREGELALPGYSLFNGYRITGTWFRFTIGESEINGYAVNQSLVVGFPYNHKTISTRIAAIKQLPRYAENSSTAPNYKPGESIYELKLVPLQEKETEGLFANSVVLLK